MEGTSDPAPSTGASGGRRSGICHFVVLGKCRECRSGGHDGRSQRRDIAQGDGLVADPLTLAGLHCNIRGFFWAFHCPSPLSNLMHVAWLRVICLGGAH
jgi:hypothetical protein